MQRGKEHPDTQQVLRSGQPGDQDWDKATAWACLQPGMSVGPDEIAEE